MRLSLWTASLVVGISIALASECSPATVTFAAPLLAALAFLLARCDRRALGEALVAAAIGGYAGARARQPPPLPPALADALDGDRPVEIEGWALSAPEQVDGGSRIRFAVERIDGQRAEAVVALAVAHGAPEVLPGDGARVVARLRSVRGLANPGLPDSTLQARAAGIDAYAGVGDAASVSVLGGGSPIAAGSPARLAAALLRAAARARLTLGRAIDEVVRGPPGALLHTAVLGERRGNDPTVEEGFRAAGATHVLSVSGLHLAAIALAFFVGARRVIAAVPRLPLWADPKTLAAWLALPAIAFYTLLTGGAVATVRAAVMMSVALLGITLGRRHHPLAAIAAAVWVLCAVSPLVVVDVSFQLSVASVLALAGVALRGRPSPNSHRWSRRIVRAAGRLGAATLAAWLTTAPCVAHHFGEVTPAAPLGNLVLIPLIELVVVPCGLGGAALGAVFGHHLSPSWPLLFVAGQAARLSLAVAEMFRLHAPLWLTRAPNGIETLALSMGVGCLFAAGFRSSGRRRLLVGIGVTLVATAAVSLGGRELRRRSDDRLIVTFLDVGQGDAAVVQFPAGRTMLIDGGGTYDGSFDPGARVVEPFLRGLGVTRLELVALSHPHPDHMGGLHRILARFPVGSLWTSGDDGRNPDYGRLLDQARARAVPTPVPARWSGEGVTVEPLGPFVSSPAGGGEPARPEHIGPPVGATVNDASLVLRVSFAGRSLLFTGDIEADGEGELAGRPAVGQVVASDVLKVPHHGSRTSSGDELLDAVRPGLAVMSLGWGNRFHFPRPEVVERYRRRGVRLLRTDLDGAVTVAVAPNGTLSATCARGCR